MICTRCLHDITKKHCNRCIELLAEKGTVWTQFGVCLKGKYASAYSGPLLKVEDTKQVTITEELYNQLEYLGIVGADVRNTNVGESDYSTQLIQPWTIWLAYPNLTSWDHDIIKRILRNKSTDPRIMDYQKVIHICQERIRQLELKDS